MSNADEQEMEKVSASALGIFDPDVAIIIQCLESLDPEERHHLVEFIQGEIRASDTDDAIDDTADILAFAKFAVELTNGKLNSVREDIKRQLTNKTGIAFGGES